ncbi:MAG: MlaD family protein [Terrimicrobiaceae bacterium]|nr:MlaD family protein [Terrimicrobiaceae bacterium]
MSSEKVTQTRVGFFILLGLVAICAMVVYFGRFGDGLKKFYDVRVEYPNASGLFSGADVLLAGARIGSVKDGPYVLGSMRGVYVILKIYEGVQIPEGSAFTIGSSGLLGDSFVDITMPARLDVEHYKAIAPDSTVIGKRESGGIAELTGEGGKLVDDVRQAVKHIDAVVARINDEVLNKQSVAAVNETLQNLKTTSSEFTRASQKLDTVVEDASTAMKKVGDAVTHIMHTTDKTADTLSATKDAAVSFDKTMVEIRLLVRDARYGKGALGTLISDRAVAENLKALVANLRARGILWYKDAGPSAQKPASR